MSQHTNSLHNNSTGSTPNPKRNHRRTEDSDVARLEKKSSNETNIIVDRLTKLIRLPGVKLPQNKGTRRNRNEVYAMLLAMLIKQNHLNGMKYAHEIELIRELKLKSNSGDFLLVLRADGRIVLISEEAEHHLGKTMRTLYSQCINIFNCLGRADGEKLRQILNSSQNDCGQEHQLVCTFRLPKGKRPSRSREDITTITMAGHFYSCHDPSLPHEKLFVARCQALVSRTTNKMSSSESETASSNTSSIMEITLNDDMTISTISSNTEEILGYRRNELINNLIARFLPTEDWQHLEENCRKAYQQGEKNLPTFVSDVCDIYSNNGDGRLTFLYQIRARRTRKTRPIKYDIRFQMIDPSLRSEYVKYLQIDNKSIAKVEQVNLVSPAVSKTSEDSFMADSSSLSGGLLSIEQFSEPELSQQLSPDWQSLSEAVAPVEFDERSWSNLVDFDKSSLAVYFPDEFVDVFSQCFNTEPINEQHDERFDLLYFDDGFCF